MSLFEESGFPARVRSDHAGPSRRASAEEKAKEEEDDARAQPLSSGRAEQEEGPVAFGTSGSLNYAVLCRADGLHP